MPLVRVDVIEGRSPERVRGIADAIHRAIVAEYRIPERDRFQVVSELRSNGASTSAAWRRVVRDAEVWPPLRSA